MAAAVAVAIGAAEGVTTAVAAMGVTPTAVMAVAAAAAAVGGGAAAVVAVAAAVGGGAAAAAAVVGACASAVWPFVGDRQS